MSRKHHKSALVPVRPQRFGDRLLKWRGFIALFGLVLLTSVGLLVAEVTYRSDLSSNDQLPESFAEFEELRNQSDPVAVRGTVEIDEAQSDRLIVAELVPPVDQEATAEETASIPRVGVAKVHDDGTYELRLDVSSPIFDGVSTIGLTYVEGDEIVGVAMVELDDLRVGEPDSGEGSDDTAGSVLVVDIERLVP
jgi:hypothetical protein